MCGPTSDLAHAVENVVDGVYFNSGQCCCGIERVYVHADVYDKFVDGFVTLTKQYVLDDPLDQKTTLGPMAQPRLAKTVRDHIGEAAAQGREGADRHQGVRARPGWLDLRGAAGAGECRSLHEGDDGGDVRTGRRHHEGEGRRRGDPPDEQLALWADRLDLDARHGRGRAHRREIETGTVYMNRCDYLDPGLAWTGVKDTGRGATLSRVGYESLTRPKSYHLREV